MLNKDDQIEKLTALNDELENYFRNTIIPQLFVDADLILRKFTPPAMKQFKLSNDDMGKSIRDIKDNFRFPTIVENIEQVIESNEILEKEIQTNDFRWYQMNIIPYVAKQDKKTDGVIITFVEITMRIKDLKDLEKLISDHETLLDTLSHDFKTPLTSLVLSMEVLKRTSVEKPEMVGPLLEKVEGGIKKMQLIINELTDTRRQEHKYRAEEELLNFEHILEDVRLIISDQITDSGAMITSEIDISEVVFSRRKLRSIIYNLVNNAIKFKSPERQLKIVISTKRKDNFFVISVKDNGIGIVKTKQEAVFSKYFRVQNTIEGTGVGLYLVREMVNSAGGKISLQSETGKGSEFKVYLKIE